MKTKIRVADSPTGSARTGQSISVRRIADGVTLDSLRTDADGFATFQRDGHTVPYYFLISGVTGGVRIWRSDDMATVGPSSPQDWPTALIPLENGVIRGVGSSFEVAGSGVGNVTIGEGAAIIQGHPVVFYGTTQMTYSRPASGTRVYRFVLQLNFEGSEHGGEAIMTYQVGDDLGSVPALEQNALLRWEIPIARVTVPSAGSVTIDDERQLIHSERHAPVYGESYQVGQRQTDNAVGEEINGAAFMLDLPDESIYDITATLSVHNGPVAGATFWSQQLSLSGFSNPQQVATDSTGRVYVADYSNSRLVILNSSGAFQTTLGGLPSITGVAVDPSGNVYITYIVAGVHRLLRKNSDLLATDWVAPFGSYLAHVATDGTYVYVTDPNTAGGTVYKRLCSTGAAVTSWACPHAAGIAYSAGFVYVTDSVSDGIRKFTTTGSLSSSIFPSGSGTGEMNSPVGITPDDSGDLWVCDYLNGRLQRFSSSLVYQEAITFGGSLVTPNGIASAAGDILWFSDFAAGSISKWDEVTSGAGYGAYVISLDGAVGTYLGMGNQDGEVMTSWYWAQQGGYGVTATLSAYVKAVSGTATYSGTRLSATARPRR